MSKSKLTKSSFQPPSTVLNIKCKESGLERKLGLYNGTTMQEIYASVKAVFDIPSKFGVSLTLAEENTEFVVSDLLPSRLSLKLVKKPKKRTMWYRDITGEWMMYLPKRKRRKIEDSDDKKVEDTADLQDELSQEEKTTMEGLNVPNEPAVPKVPVKVLGELDEGPEGFVGAAAAKGANGILVCGGLNSEGEVSAETATFDLDLHDWEKGMNDEPRCYHSVTWIPGREQYFAFGGYVIEDDKKIPMENPRGCQDDCWFASELQGERPEARYGHTITAIDDFRLFLFGGFDVNFPRKDCRVLDAENWTWKIAETAGTCPSARGFHTATKVGEKVIFIGGCDKDSCFDSVHVLNCATMEWSQPQLSGVKLKARCCHQATILDETKIAIFGGRSGFDENSEKVQEILILDTKSWAVNSIDLLYGLNSLCISGAVTAPIQHEDGQIWIFGGEDCNRVRIFSPPVEKQPLSEREVAPI